MVPAFVHEIVMWRGKKQGIIRPSATCLELLRQQKRPVLIEPWAMPMIIPPRPWLTYHSGGYLTQRHLFVRLKDEATQLALIHEANRGKAISDAKTVSDGKASSDAKTVSDGKASSDGVSENAEGSADAILKGLDILGRTAWMINEGVLEQAVGLWNEGMDVATLEKPPAPNHALLNRKYHDFTDKKEYSRWRRQSREHELELAKYHSTMCDTNYKLEIAQQFKGRPFYLPHSVDFRGRAYPIPPHLSHTGSDLARGLMQFAEARPLGSRGLFWLRVHAANMWGVDKVSLAEREAWSLAHRQEMRDAIQTNWWRSADAPWQFLAACIELTRIEDLQTQGQAVEQIESRLPVQQDGSCNGLQHYAALGRDPAGAASVNLSPHSKPQDVYAEVANLVSAAVDRDAAMGMPLAVQLQGKITRKLVKQPVMTNVYGVTVFGARQQVEERLKEMQIVTPEQLKDARSYLTLHIFASLSKLFVNAKRIQDWLNQAAEEICRSMPVSEALKCRYKEGLLASELGNYRRPNYGGDEDMDGRYPQSPVTWTTPLGFRVVQPYFKSNVIQLRTSLQSLSIINPTSLDPVDLNKQVAGFPPNFIHSLDATHMFMTALSCHSQGITFASVHDCFWTHPSTVDSMNTIIRDCFIQMHGMPLLEKLYSEMLDRYAGHVVPIAIEGEDGKKRAAWRPLCIPPVPPRGDFDIEQVRQSVYFFS